jgi:signal transduction histidine kinase
VHDRVFDPAFTTKAAGAGLGLSIVKRLVDAHRGTVRVENRPTGGTAFYVTFPELEEGGA